MLGRSAFSCGKCFFRRMLFHGFVPSARGRQLSLKLGGPMDLSRSSFDTHATLTVAFPPQCALKWHTVAGMMEHYDSRPKSLLEVKKATGGSGSSATHCCEPRRSHRGRHPFYVDPEKHSKRSWGKPTCTSPQLLKTSRSTLLPK